MAGSGQIMDLGTRYRLDQALSVAAAREDEILGGKDELDRASNFIQPAGPWVSPGPGQERREDRAVGNADNHVRRVPRIHPFGMGEVMPVEKTPEPRAPAPAGWVSCHQSRDATEQTVASGDQP